MAEQTAGVPDPVPTRVLVVAGGDVPPEPALAGVLPATDLVIAADSGLHHALALGRRPQIVIGDQALPGGQPPAVFAQAIADALAP